MNTEQLIEEYRKLDSEGKKLLSEVQGEKDRMKNAIATIKLNAYTQAKQHILLELGRLQVEDFRRD